MTSKPSEPNAPRGPASRTRVPESITTLRESKAALLEAMTEVVNAPRRGPISAKPARRSRTPIRVTLGMIVLAGIALLIVRPVWLAGETTVVETPRIKRASAVLSVVEAMGRVKGYRARTGRLPGSLAAAGVTNRELRLIALGNNEFEISLSRAGEVIKLRSTDSLTSTFVSSVKALKERK